MLYAGPFDAEFVAKLKPNAALLATLPEKAAAEFAACSDDPAACTRAWMSACLHFFPDNEHAKMSTFRHARPGSVPAKTQPTSEAEPSPRERLQSLTMTTLKAQLVERGLKVSGKKGELIDRLLEDDDTQSPVADTESPVTVLAAPVQDVEDVQPEVENVASPPQATVATVDATADAQDDPGEAVTFQKKTVPQLKDLLRENNLKVSGKKADLVDRCLANGLSAS